MATLATLADDVYVLTNRPDLVSETRVALRKAIMKLHSADTFKRDLVTQRLQMALYSPTSPGLFRWVIQLSDFPLFRRPKFLRYPPELAIPVQIPAPLIDYTGVVRWQREFKEVAADQLFDAYSSEWLNYFYVAGSSLVIKAAYGVDYLDFSYYKYPTIPTSTSDPIVSWICDQYPDAAIEEAAGTVFKMIGKDDEHARYQSLFAENIAILRGTDLGEGV